ncbi:MAG: hypothetical protein LLG04_04155 [Parachlamydia sp.]|nr:hypothetical protein [Parachlamydia sp.]
MRFCIVSGWILGSLFVWTPLAPAFCLDGASVIELLIAEEQQTPMDVIEKTFQIMRLCIDKDWALHDSFVWASVVNLPPLYMREKTLQIMRFCIDKSWTLRHSLAWARVAEPSTHQLVAPVEEDLRYAKINAYDFLPPAPVYAREKLLKNKAVRERYRVFGEVVWLKAVEEGLRYAETNTYDFSPPGRSINQQFNYRFGGKVGLDFPISYDKVELGVLFMNYCARPNSVEYTDDNQCLFACLNNATYLPYGQAQCGYVKGKWHCDVDQLDLEIKRPIHCGRSLSIYPVLGISGSYVRQRVDVKYKKYYIPDPDSPFVSAQKIIGTCNTWGAGPAIGVLMRFAFPKKIGLMIRGSAALMSGRFRSSTKHTDFTASVDCSEDLEASIFRTSGRQLFSLGQIQARLYKKWITKNRGSYEIEAGWEAQSWTKQMRMTWFSSITQEKESSLTLYGPFFRLTIGF